ncbi:S-adenosyl-L-methionine-dependent methyltransferase [Thozetella sp. PMI_491]|nr:S-adenosyl-L-methionine-dependent methyltransferase [Thozetella sp. PMI_491]
MQYRSENGRTYHAYKAGKYIFPNDDPCATNVLLDLQHHLFSLTFGGKLFLCPAGKDKQLHSVLDVGTGTGIWALDMADAYPEASVIGVDLSPIQPQFVPPNLTYFVDDIEETWTFSNKFDFIYGRMLTGSFANWPRFFEQSFEFLNPGGWIEMSDIVCELKSDDNTVPENSPLKKWTELSLEASKKLGRSIDSAKQYKDQLEAAGFVNVTAVQYKWPLNPWPADPKYKELGTWTQHNMLGGISGLSMALYTRGHGWTMDELEAFLVDVRKEWKLKSIHGYWPIYVVYGQKPE